MFRLLAIASLVVRFAFADDSPQDVVEKLASQIQKGDAKAALDLFDSKVPEYSEWKRNIEALNALPDTNCSIVITKTSSTGNSVQFVTDWTLQTYPIQNGPLLDRRDSATISLRRDAGSWKITAVSPAGLIAPPDGQAFKLIAQLASDLNDKEESGALSAFDSSMRQYGEIDNDIDALVTQFDVLCAIDIVSDRFTGGVHTLDLDWYMELKSRADGGAVIKRRERVQVTLSQIHNKWKIGHISSIIPLSPLIDR